MNGRLSLFQRIKRWFILNRKQIKIVALLGLIVIILYIALSPSSWTTSAINKISNNGKLTELTGQTGNTTNNVGERLRINHKVIKGITKMVRFAENPVTKIH